MQEIIRGSISVSYPRDAEQIVCGSITTPAVGMTKRKDVIPRRGDIYEMQIMRAVSRRLLTLTKR